MNTKRTGDISEAVAITALLKGGANVLIPFGDCNRYDLVAEFEDKFYRIQVKTGWIEKGNIRASVSNNTTEDGKTIRRSYKGQVDFFIIFCRETDKLYLLPIEACSDSDIKLRLEKPKNNQKVGIKMASDYEFNGSVTQLVRVPTR